MQQSVDLFRAFPVDAQLAWALNNLGLVKMELGDYDAAKSAITESLRIFRQVGDRRGIAAATFAYGKLLNFRGEFAEAQQVFSQSLNDYRAVGDETARFMDSLHNGVGCFLFG